MPLPESEIPGPEDLNPLVDVLYLENGAVKKIVPKHPRTRPRELLMVAEATIQMLGDALHGPEEKYKLKSQPTWVDCLLADIANELNLSGKTLVWILNGFHKKDYCVQHLNTDGFRCWAIKEGLDQLHPFLDHGIEEIKAYHESKSAPEPHTREDGPSRQSGLG